MQTIEARAILSASDKTGGIFARIAAKIKGMNAAAMAANRSTMATGAVASGAVARASRSSAAANAAMLGATSRVLAPAAIAYAGAKAYKNYADADLAITRIGITADGTEEQISKLGTSMRDLASESGKSFEEVSKGLESLVAGGMNLPEALPALPAIAKTAQAAGAEVQDMATTTLALNQNLGISTDKMQNAFDILVTGGKAGKFELKDMARYFPSIAPAAVAAGMKGEEGLMRIVAALQTIRAGTGTTEEAASSMQNIFAKMESEATVTKFEKFGIDLRKEMTKARKEGKDLLEVFVGLSDKALKGDLSKIPQLFSDMEFARGMRGLLSFRELNKKVLEDVRNSAGSTAKDLDKVLKTPAIAVDRLSESFSRLGSAIGFAIEKAGGLLHKGGTSGMITDAAKFVEDVATGKHREDTIADKERLMRRYQRDSAEIVAGTWWHGNDGKGQLNKNTMEQQAARLKAFELRMAEGVGSELGKELFTPHELSRFPSYLGFGEGPEDPRKKGVPMPASDPRKQTPAQIEMPPVQSLDVTAELKGEADVKGTVETKVIFQAGDGLIKIVEEMKSIIAKVEGKLRANGPGSTGVSSPDAAPAPSVGMGAP